MTALLEMMVEADLQPRDAVGRQQVIAVFRELEVEHRKDVRHEALRMGGLEPAEHLALGHGDLLQRRHHVADPRARRQNQPPGLVAAPCRGDAHAAAGDRSPFEHRLAPMDLGACGHRECCVGDDGALRQHEAAIRLEQRHEIIGQAVAGMAGVHLPPGQHFMRQPMLAAGFQRAAEDVAVRRAAVQRSGGDQQRLAGRLRRFPPQFVGPAQQGHIGRALVIGEADDARHTVRRALRMGDVEAFQPEHALAAAGELPAGGGAHAAASDDDHVIAVAARHAFSPASAAALWTP